MMQNVKFSTQRMSDPRLKRCFIFGFSLLARMILFQLMFEGGTGMALGQRPTKHSRQSSKTTTDSTKHRFQSSTKRISPRAVASFALMESTYEKGNQNAPPKIAIRILELNPTYLAMDYRDRAFARLLLTTTERRLGQIDKVIDGYIHKSLSMVCG